MPDKVSKTRFNKAPVIGGKGRTRFDLSHPILTTGNTGEFIPILAEPVFPGETFSLKNASLTRLETSLHQTMDNAYVEFAYFFVPNRIIWDDFEKFLGASDNPWAQQNTYTIPQLRLTDTSGSVRIYTGSILNHLGVPAGSYGSGTSDPYYEINALPLRAIFQVWNDWYRDENYDTIIAFSKNSNDLNANFAFVLNGSAVYPNTADNLHVNRFKDIFSTALPAPQKGSEITFGVGGLAPIIAGSTAHNTSGALDFHYSGDNGGGYHLLYDDVDSLGNHKLGVTNNGTATVTGTVNTIDRTNAVADLSQATLVTINQLRLSIAAQAIKERDARGGTRYKEKIYSTWKVQANDLELDRSEFLGGKRIPISMMEVLQTSETGTTVLGTNAGVSKTIDVSDGFVKSFTQYGWIVGFVYVRTSRSYSQGIDRKLRDKTYYDLYDPMLDNIGEVGVKKSEIFSLIDDSTDPGATYVTSATAVVNGNSNWAYQEAWYHLKERCGRFSGYFQPGVQYTMDSWHYGDSYKIAPQMSASWLKEGPEQVDRTIAVQSSASYQWTFNIYFELYATRQMAKYSIPNTFGF